MTRRAVQSAWVVVALLAAAHMMSFVDRLLIGLLAEPIKAELGLSDTGLGLLQGTGFVILYGLAAIPFGLVADRGNRRNLIIAGMIVWSGATALCGLARSFDMLFLARIAVGLGEAALIPAAMSLIAAVLPREKLGFGVGIFVAGGALGKSASLLGGGLILAFLIQRHGLFVPGQGRLAPWRGTFVIMALPGLLIALLLLTLREPPRGTPERSKGRLTGAIAHVRRHWQAYVTHTGASSCVVLLSQTFGSWSPSLFIRFFHLSAPQTGFALGSILLVAAPLGHLAGGAFMDRISARGSAAPAVPALVVGLAGTLAGVVLLLSMQGLPAALVCFGVTCFFMSLGSPATLACVQMLAPPVMRGVVSALFLAVTTLIGTGVGPLLVGMITDLLGGPQHLNLALGIVIALFAGSGIILAIASAKPFGRALTQPTHP